MKKKKTYLLLLLFLLAGQWAQAQESLQVDSVFTRFGKEKGTVLVELGTDILGRKTNIKSYKSLRVEYMLNDQLDWVREVIADDSKGGEVLEMSKKDGKVVKASYLLNKRAEKDFEYILFQVKGKTLTLIYLRGPFSPPSLDKELKKLTKLLISIK